MQTAFGGAAEEAHLGEAEREWGLTFLCAAFCGAGKYLATPGAPDADATFEVGEVWWGGGEGRPPPSPCPPPDQAGEWVDPGKRTVGGEANPTR